MNHTNISALFILSHLAIIISFLLFSYKEGWLKLDHRSLFHQKLFWIAILIPALTFLAYGAWAWWGHSPDLSGNGFEVFYNISKLPLLFLATSVPLASIVNNIHRTIQTEKQINEAERKNLSDAYYTHLKHTLDLIKEIEYKDLFQGESMSYSKFRLSIKNPISLYKTIFRQSSHSNGATYQADEWLLKSIRLEWVEINKSLKKLNQILSENKQNKLRETYRKFINIYRIERSFETICRLLNLNNNSHLPRPLFECGELKYSGLFYDSNSLSRGIEELDNICQKIFDIINANNTDIYIDKHYFLNQRPYVVHSLPPLKNHYNVFQHQVSLRLIRRRQSGGS